MNYVSLKNIGVEFPVFIDSTRQSLRSKLVELGSGGRITSTANDRVVVKGLQDISLEAKSGDRVGLIGRNGAGKSTLLKTLGGICHHTHGEMVVQGQCTTLLSAGGMIDPNRSGYENIRYMGMLLGFSDEQLERIVPDIEEFTELKEYLHLPVKTYSAGMSIRLSFAIITAVETDILLIDEVIGAGDAGFIEKAWKRAEAMYNRADILFLASHSEAVIKMICNRVLYLEEGRVLFDGPPNEAFELYRNA